MGTRPVDSYSESLCGVNPNPQGGNFAVHRQQCELSALHRAMGPRSVNSCIESLCGLKLIHWLQMTLRLPNGAGVLIVTWHHIYTRVEIRISRGTFDSPLIR